MEINLTGTQWHDLKDLIDMGRMAESKIGLPVEITNGTQKIEIEADGTTTITLD